MLSPLQQAIDTIQKNQNVLIALPESLNGDAVGSALALGEALKKLGKRVGIAAQESIPEELSFLSGWENIKNQLYSWRDFIISIDTAKNKISRLRYETENTTLKIFLTTPQKIEERDIKLEPGPFYYDLIITLDAPDLESLGKIFEENTELFFQKPILNIDHKAANEYFGEVNLVETTAAACGEIIANLITALGPELVNEKTATALLTGLIVKTRSFQNARTTPQVLTLASQLITQGAARELIVQHLYKTKPLNRLRLLGRLLSRLEYDEIRKIIWLLARPEDFREADGSPRDLVFVLEEIENIFPQAALIFLLWPDENCVLWALAQAKQPEVLQKISLETAGTFRNNRLLLKLADVDLLTGKERLSALLNSLG